MRAPRTRVPERLTLVCGDDNRTLVVDDELGPTLVITATKPGAEWITCRLDEAQARRLVARIRKFFNDNR